MRLGLGMIVKDEVKELDSILNSCYLLFNEIQITITSPNKRKELEEVIKKYDGVPSYFEWENDFAKARNFNKAQFKTCDYYFTIDADDTITNPSSILEVAEQAHKDKISIVLCWYDYGRDQDGNTNAGHYKERIIKLEDCLKWNKRIHENVVTTNPSTYKVMFDKQIKIIHNKTNEQSYESAIRNIKYLLEEYNKDKENTDPRTLAYLGRMFMGVGDFDKAVPFLEQHIQKSGWDEDRYVSWCYLAEIFKQKGDLAKATACCFEALAERVDWPDAYFKMHDIYFEKEEWEKAIEWGEMGMRKPTPETVMILDPSSYTWRPALSMAFAYFKVGQFEKAKKLFDFAKKMVPTLPFVKSNEALFQDAIEHKNFVENFLRVFYFVQGKQSGLVQHLLKAIPDCVENEVLISLKNKHLPPKVWSDDEVVLLCVGTPESWSPKSLDTGIGGSEEAVINLSKELKELGYKVTVYLDCGEDEGEYDGVKYVNHYKFNIHDEFSTLISWRTNIFSHGVKARRRIVWLHDIPQHMFHTKDEVVCVDKIVVLSDYHAGLLNPVVPKEKIYVSANGVDYSLFKNPVQRNPKKMVYTSSYIRGIEHLLDAWPEVKKEVPEAELHLCYGWQTFNKMSEGDKYYEEIKNRISAKIKQDGIVDHGRISQKEVADLMLSSGIYVYPCKFPEISCISAMKAQVAGCVPIVTDFAAMKETVKEGVIVPGTAEDKEVMKEFVGCLIKVLQEEKLQEKIRKACLDINHDFSWKAVAKDWEENLFNSIEDITYHDRVPWIQKQIPRTETVVDIGGNDGHTFIDRPRDNVTTVDIDLYDIPNFVRSDAHSLPFEDGKFDTAVLAEILEHVEDPVKCMKEAKRVAKRVVITIPYEYEWKSSLKPFQTAEDDRVRHGHSTLLETARIGNPTAVAFHEDDGLHHLWHHRHYTKESLREDLVKAGFDKFKITKLKHNDWVWYGVVAQ